MNEILSFAFLHRPASTMAIVLAVRHVGSTRRRAEIRKIVFAEPSGSARSSLTVHPGFLDNFLKWLNSLTRMLDTGCILVARARRIAIRDPIIVATLTREPRRAGQREREHEREPVPKLGKPLGETFTPTFRTYAARYLFPIGIVRRNVKFREVQEGTV